MDLEAPAEETPAEEKTVITESPTGGESDVCEIDTRREPYEGMVFESEDAAKIFYDEYARRAGFSTRIISSRKSERDGSIISRHLACNKEGFNANRRKSGRVQIRKRESIREGCRAMILVKREKPGRWVVTKFEKEHNHLLLSSGKDGPSPDEKDRKIRELSMELHRANQKLEACQEQLQIVMSYIEEHAKCLSKTVEEAVKDIQNLTELELQKYRHSVTDPQSQQEMGTLGRAVYTVGFWIRETGQALDRLGCRLQGNYYFQEQLSRHRTLMNIFDKAPAVDKDAFVAPSASIIGDVQVGRGSSIWYGCVLRGDVNSISVGSGTNIQDNSLVHVAKSNLSGKVLPTTIGDNVTVGHSAVLHGCTVEDEAFVGMGATLLDGVVVERHGMVAAGSLVRQNTRIPSGEVWGGNPAKFLRKLTDEEIAFISQSATNYSNLAQVHAAENAKSFDEIEFEKVLRKKFARRDEEYDSMLGVVRETPQEIIVPDSIKDPKSLQK